MTVVVVDLLPHVPSRAPQSARDVGSATSYVVAHVPARLACQDARGYGIQGDDNISMYSLVFRWLGLPFCFRVHGVACKCRIHDGSTDWKQL